MERHEHSTYATHEEVNQFGKRVGAVEVSQAEERVKTERNEEDINKLFELVGENAKTIGKVEKSMAGLSGKIAGVVAAVSTVVFIGIEIAKHFIGK